MTFTLAYVGQMPLRWVVPIQRHSRSALELMATRLSGAGYFFGSSGITILVTTSGPISFHC